MEGNLTIWKFQSMLCLFWSDAKVPHLCGEHVIEQIFLFASDLEVRKRKNKDLILLFPSRTHKQPTPPHQEGLPLKVSISSQKYKLKIKPLLCEPFRDFLAQNNVVYLWIRKPYI